MLDGRQRAQSLRRDPRGERATETVRLAGTGAELGGLPVGALSRDQQDHVRQVMADVLAPFREEDRREVLQLIEANGFEKLHLSFFQNMDIGDDGVWDVWQLESPSMLWYFRGKPHVHVWVNVRAAE